VYSDARAAESNDPMLRMTWWIEISGFYQIRRGSRPERCSCSRDGYRLLIGENTTACQIGAACQIGTNPFPNT
jgi:hypothetical protein